MQTLITFNRPYYLHTNVSVLCSQRKRVCSHVLPITAVYSRGEPRVNYGHRMLYKFQDFLNVICSAVSPDKLTRVNVWRDQSISSTSTAVEGRLLNYERTTTVKSNQFNWLISNWLSLSSTEYSVRKYADLIRFAHYGYNDTSASKYYTRDQDRVNTRNHSDRNVTWHVWKHFDLRERM
jgi:hypothetical protein